MDAPPIVSNENRGETVRHAVGRIRLKRCLLNVLKGNHSTTVNWDGDFRSYPMKFGIQSFFDTSR